MFGVLDLETIETEKTNESQNQVRDTWILRLPKDVCEKEGLAEGTLVSLTIKNSGIQSQFISPPSKKLQKISKKVLEKDRELHRRLKELGD